MIRKVLCTALFLLSFVACSGESGAPDWSPVVMEAVDSLDTAAGKPKDGSSYGYNFAAACNDLVEALRQRKGNEPLRTELVRELMMLAARAETIRAFDTQTPHELARDWESLRAKLKGQSSSKPSE